MCGHVDSKDHSKYAQAVLHSAETRRHFDAGALSEPVMLRNLFVAWLRGLDLGDLEAADATARSA